MSLDINPGRTALIIQDLQNDVVARGGAFEEAGTADHAEEQDVLANVSRLAHACRAAGVMVVHVWFVVDEGAPGVPDTCPLCGMVRDGGNRRGTWGAGPAEGVEPKDGDHVVEKMRMCAFEGTHLDQLLRSEGRDTIINTGALTNMAVEHTARTGADKGYRILMPDDGCSSFSAEWHRASIDHAIQNVATVTTVDEVISGIA